MKSFGTYISKHLASFAAFLLILVIVNVVLYGVTFYHTVSEDYGEASPHAMLELTSTAATTEGLPDYAEQKLRQYNIWADIHRWDGHPARFSDHTVHLWL